MAERQLLIRPGRPRIEVDFALVLRLRDVENLGWSRGAARYREITKKWVSRDTFKRRYYEAKAAKSPLERVIEELGGKLKTWGVKERQQ